jgi:D-alanine-D-alanine ligase-like ATP-grasp enzyme
MPQSKTARRPEAQTRTIALLVDEETGTRSRSGRFVPERGSVEARVLAQLVEHYGDVKVVPFTRNVVATIEELRAADPEIVFNLTEWLDGMRLARDKALSKEIVSKLGVDVPRHVVVHSAEEATGHDLAYPLVVKPQFGDASETMSANSMVKDADELRSRVQALHERLKAPLICEEFIPGRDLYVALLGREPDVMPPVELVIGKKGSAAPQLATYRLKNDAAYRTRWRIRWKPATLDDAMVKSIESASRSVFHALKLRDYARLDFRLTPDKRLYFLEANPNPDLHPHAMGLNLCFAGVAHGDAIRRIVEAAYSRTPSDLARRS